MMAAPGGNSDRGWNDPPPLMSENGADPSSFVSSKPKTVLNKRVADPSMTSSGNVKVSERAKQRGDTTLPTLASSPPRLHPFLKGSIAKAPPASDSPITHPIPSHDGVLSSVEARDPQTEAASDAPTDSERKRKVNTALETLIDRLRHENVVGEKQLHDISRKMRLIEESWTSDGLEKEVKDKLERIAAETEAGRWEEALQLQMTLAVSHPGSVTRWAMALKKLLLESRRRCPAKKEETSTNTDPSQPKYFVPSMT